MEALLALEDRHLDEQLTVLMDFPLSRMGHALAAGDQGRCRGVAVSGFRSLSADAGVHGQKAADGDEVGDLDDLGIGNECADINKQGSRPGNREIETLRSHGDAALAQQRLPAQHRRNRSIGVPSEFAASCISGTGHFPRAVANGALPPQHNSPQRISPGGAPIRKLSPGAKELGLTPGTAQGGSSVPADSLPQRRRSEEGGPKEAAQGRNRHWLPAGHASRSPLSALSPAESATATTADVAANAPADSFLPQDKNPGLARYQHHRIAPSREAHSAAEEAEGDSAGGLTLSSGKGVVVPKLSNLPHKAHDSPHGGTFNAEAPVPSWRGAGGAGGMVSAGAASGADLEPPPIKVGPGLRASRQHREQCSPPSPNCLLPSASKVGASSALQNAEWRSPKLPSPGGSPLLHSMPSGDATSAQDYSYINRLTAGTSGSGEMLTLRTPPRAPLGPQSLHSSPVSSPASRRGPLTGGAGLSAMQVGQLGTATVNPVASSASGVVKGSGGVRHRRTASYSVECQAGMSTGVPAARASRVGHRRSPSFEGSAIGAYEEVTAGSKLVSAGSAGVESVLVSNWSMSPVNAAHTASAANAGIPYTAGLSSSSRSRFGLLSNTECDIVGKGQGQQHQQHEVSRDEAPMFWRGQRASALESAANQAKRAAIRKGVRDLQQAQRQRIHRRGASFAAEGGVGNMDVGSLHIDRELDAFKDVRQRPQLEGTLGAHKAEVSSAAAGKGAMGARYPLPAQRGRPALSPLSQYRHSWGNESDFQKNNPFSQDSIPGEGGGRGGGAVVDLVADYSFKRGQDLVKVLQQNTGGEVGFGLGVQAKALNGVGALARPRHQPRHSMDSGQDFSTEGLEGAQGSSQSVLGPWRNGSVSALKDSGAQGSNSGGCSMHLPSPKQVLSGMMGGVGLIPSDHVLGLPYDDVTRLYVMHRKDLGAGQFGVVRRCKEIATGSVFACKSIRKETIRCPEDASDIRKEVACMRLLQKHPRFLNLHAAVEDKDHVHLVMDLCAGGDLLDTITEKGPLPEASAARMATMLVEALLHCHCLGIVHRDVKPENILLVTPSADTDMKLVDFGVSTFVKPGEKLKEIIGTPEYMAPEMLRQSYGPEADIWSAGVVLYVALTSVPPFWASDRQSLTESILNKEVRFKASRWSGISTECKDLVNRMLVKDPEKRIKATDVLRHPWTVRHCRV